MSYLKGSPVRAEYPDIRVPLLAVLALMCFASALCLGQQQSSRCPLQEEEVINLACQQSPLNTKLSVLSSRGLAFKANYDFIVRMTARCRAQDTAFNSALLNSAIQTCKLEPAPEIVLFEGPQSPIDAGGAAHLRWKIINAVRADLNGDPVPIEGEKDFSGLATNMSFLLRGFSDHSPVPAERTVSVSVIEDNLPAGAPLTLNQVLLLLDLARRLDPNVTLERIARLTVKRQVSFDVNEEVRQSIISAGAPAELIVIISMSRSGK